MTPSDFFTEHVLEHNQKTTATPTLTVIAAADNHYLPLFVSLALVPSPLTLISSGTITSPSWRIVYSPQSGSTMPIPMLICCLRWFGTSSELGSRRRREDRGSGYRVVIRLGPSSTVRKLSQLQIILRIRRARRKIGRGIRVMKRRSRDHHMAYLLLQG